MKILYFGTNQVHAPGEWCIKRIFDHYTFSYFLTPYLYEKDSKILSGEAGDFIIIPPRCVVYHGPTSDMSGGFENDWLYAMGEEVDSLLEKYPLPLFEPFKISSPDLLKKCVLKIEKEFDKKESGFHDKMAFTVSSFIVDLWRSYLDANANDSTFDPLERSRAKLLDNIAVSTPLSELASISGYSQSRFCALYVEKYGISPKADLMRERISLSKRLLKFSEKPIEEIALQLGFGSIGHFSKYFKKTVGKTPTEYRNQTVIR
jgi:AraC-like DNA-binding protein